MGSEQQWAVIGRSVSLLARASEGKIIQFCRWDATGNSSTGSEGIIFVNTESTVPSSMISTHTQHALAGYPYYGRGLSNGECGIAIESVTEADITVWKCIFIEFNPSEANPSPENKEIQIELIESGQTVISRHCEQFSNSIG
jgi:hypothetical protein